MQPAQSARASLHSAAALKRAVFTGVAMTTAAAAAAAAAAATGHMQANHVRDMCLT